MQAQFEAVADHKPQARGEPARPARLSGPLSVGCYAGLGWAGQGRPHSSLGSLPPHPTLPLKQRDKGATVSAQVNPGSGILAMGEPHRLLGWRLEVEGLRWQGPRDPSLTTGLWLLLLQTDCVPRSTC